MDVQEELDGVLCWIAALLILLLQWLYPRVPRSHVLSRMFYDHLTLSCDLTYWVPALFISLLHCMLWDFGLSVQMCGKPFPVWGSITNSTPICRTIGSDHVVGCSGAQTTTIMYLRTIYLRINLRLNNIFCCLSNFAFLNTLIIKSSNHKSVSGHLW